MQISLVHASNHSQMVSDLQMRWLSKTFRFLIMITTNDLRWDAWFSAIR